MLPFMSQGNTDRVRDREQGGRAGPGCRLSRRERRGTSRRSTCSSLEGRIPDERDAPGAPLVAVINETFARLYWPGTSPLGARIRFGGATAPWRTVVGVVRDVRERGFDLSSKPGAYVVYSQLGNAWTPEQLVVRASGTSPALVGPIREIVAEVDREQPIAAIRTMERDHRSGDRRTPAADDAPRGVRGARAAAGVGRSLRRAFVRGDEPAARNRRAPGAGRQPGRRWSA